MDLQPDLEQYQQFFAQLGLEPHSPVRLRLFVPKTHPDKNSLKGVKAGGFVCRFPNEIIEHQKKGYGVYAGINFGGDTDSEILECRALFIEHDDGSGYGRKIASLLLGFRGTNLTRTMDTSTG
jgi:hypothetical protein